jgi:uncharacterized protein YndB with AHSA1/START domain
MGKNNLPVFTVTPGIQEASVLQEFDAPRELVFRTYIDPLLYTRWLHPRGYSMVIDKFEPKDGGSYRFVHRDQNGNEFWFHGVYHEVLAPERLIYTFEYEGLPEKGHPSLEVVRFDPLPGNRTLLSEKYIFLSVSDRDGMIQKDMERGVVETHSLLDELLTELK